MIRGLHIHPYMVSGSITITLLMTRAFKSYIPAGNPIIEFFNDPLVVFIMILTAAVVITYPMLRGIKAIFISVAVVAFCAFFVFTYYMI